MPDSLATTPAERRSRTSFALDIALGCLALLLGIATFAVLAGRVKLTAHSGVELGMSVADFAVLLLLILLLAGRVIRVIRERQRGAAGARLHVRLVMLFSVVAAVPAILVAIFATVFFNIGIQAWFNQRVQTALAESSQVAQGYLDEHTNDIRLDALGIANDLAQQGPIFLGNPDDFTSYLANQSALRGLTQAVIYVPTTGQVPSSGGVLGSYVAAAPTSPELANARGGQVAVTPGKYHVVLLDSTEAVVAFPYIDAEPLD